MLIRSQNRKVVVNMDHIFVISVFDFNGEFSVVAISSGSETLGVYSSKEKADDVIDHICSAYDNCVNDTAKAVRGDWIRTVYDMPKDEDVVITDENGVIINGN